MSVLLKGVDEDFPSVTYRKDIYEYIDPTKHYESQTYKGKVVFITGASRGIGEETAKQYARAGAKVAISSRAKDALEGVKESILEEIRDAEVAVFVADVTRTEEVKHAIEAAVALFGKLDILVANAGKAGEWTKPLLEKDPDEWWSVVEVGIRGVFNSVYLSIPHLERTEGYAIVVSSRAAQVRVPYASDYCVAKHALGRLVEHICLEYPRVKALSLHPGSIPTEMGLGTKLPPPPTDSVSLPAATMLYLTAGKADWLVGRYVSANWDLEEMEKEWKSKIVKDDALISKLAIPV